VRKEESRQSVISAATPVEIDLKRPQAALRALVAVEVETTHRATPAILTLSRDPPAGENRRCRNGDDDRCAREYGLHPIARPGQR
jgi:hypothetical protein